MRFLVIHEVDATMEAGERPGDGSPVVEGWDLHGGTRPADAPHRFLLLRKANAAETNAPLPARAQQLLDGWKRDGVLHSAAALAPRAQGARSSVVGGKRIWTDGPFTGSKELVAGYSIVELPSLADEKAWADAYGAILGDNEIGVRVVATA